MLIKALLFVLLVAAIPEGSHRELPSLKVVRSASIKVRIILVCLTIYLDNLFTSLGLNCKQVCAVYDLVYLVII